MEVIAATRKENIIPKNQMQYKKMSASNDEDTIKYKALEGIERPITRLRIRKAKEACSIR